jgi:sortase A
MTITHASAPSEDKVHGSDPADAVPSAPDSDEPEEATGRRLPGRRRIILGSLLVIMVFFVAVGAVIYGIGSLVQARDQRTLMATERTNISDAAVLAKALDKVNLPTQPPVAGQPVGVLAIPALGLNQAVVEGVGSSQTVSGPGHVPGTAGLGQPGNATIVGRNAGYGGVFGRLSQLERGDKVLTATTEGQAIYVVRGVTAVTIGSSPATGGSSFDATTASGSGATPKVTLETLYRHTSDNRLTLVTSASDAPWNSSRAVVVTAVLRGKPYVATPQESLDPGQLGNTGDSSAWAELVLSMLALAAIAVGAVFLYRRCTVRSAYLLSTAPLVAVTVLAAEGISRLLPAWT